MALDKKWIGVTIVIAVTLVILLTGMKTPTEDLRWDPTATLHPKLKKAISNSQQLYPSYQDYLFWSLYGWRTDPPNEYPQSTINTPYDVTIRECTRWCNQKQDINLTPRGLHVEPVDQRRCLSDCHLKALSASGRWKNVSHQPHVKVEGFSPIGRSRPSHDSPRHRATLGTNDPSCFNW